MKTKSPKTNPSKPNGTELPTAEDFQTALELLQILGESQDEIQNITAITNNHLRGVLDDVKPKYAKFQKLEIDALAELETICRAHPEWFESKKTLDTLFGSLSLRSTPPRLVVDNPEAALAKLKLYAERAFDHTPTGDQARAAFLARYIRTKEELNLDVLKGAGSTIIAVINGALVSEEKFSAKPASINLAKATDPDHQKAA
jgi:phage host-nuclease inhibitor protein Gam